jgi:large subunit ribosomal protein L17
MWSNMVASLLEHERIKTTDVKAKELRRLAEKAIHWSTSLGDVLTKERDKLDSQERTKLVHSMRMARRMIKDPVVLTKLFEDIGPRFVGRTGGYTRVIKFRHRHGDAAPISIVELVERREGIPSTVNEKTKEG